MTALSVAFGLKCRVVLVGGLYRVSQVFLVRQERNCIYSAQPLSGRSCKSLCCWPDKTAFWTTHARCGIILLSFAPPRFPPKRRHHDHAFRLSNDPFRHSTRCFSSAARAGITRGSRAYACRAVPSSKLLMGPERHPPYRLRSHCSELTVGLGDRNADG